MNDEMGFDELLEQSFSNEKEISLGDKLEAKVIRLGKDYIFLDLGARSEGLLNREEVTTDGELTVNMDDVVTVFATAFRDGAVLCAKRIGTAAERPDDKSQAMEAFKDAFNSGIPVEGTVKESVKGGFSVTMMGQRAFCPISQIDNKFCDNPEEHLEKSYNFEIIKFEEGGRNIVVSRRKILEAEAEEMAKVMWEKMKEGESYDGTVTSIRPFGAFVNIGGAEGLLHISEISYDRVEDPSEVLEVGQKLTVAIKELDRAKNRISLSLKSMMADPWNDAINKLAVNEVREGKVVRTAQFGAFVELMPGIDGLVHISQIVKDRRLNTPREVVAEGDKVQVRVLEIDPERRRISLTMILDQEEDDNWRKELAEAPSQSAVRTENQNGAMGTMADLFKGIKK